MSRIRQLDRGARIGRPALLAVLLMGLALAGHGQGTDTSPRHYFNARSFEIPFEVPNPRAVKQVTLFVSTDGKTFTEFSTADPRVKRNFTYNAAGDGWYSFIVQVEDTAGRKTPARPEEAAIDLRVCIDTEKPTALLDPVAPQQGETVAVEWDIKDNREIDLRRLRLDYRVVGEQRWTGCNIRQLGKAQFSWSPPVAGEYDVQLTAFDMAGNMTQKQTKVKAATGGSTASNTTQPGVGGDTVKVKHVPSKTFKLAYNIENIGPSKVKSVEVWHTRDTRQWSKHTENATPAEERKQTTFEVTVPVTGRHGFTLRPISGVGRGPRAPSVNEPPQIWVEVDETSPNVRIRSVSVGEGADTGMIIVTWDARDKWLREKPVTIYYAANKPTKDSDWQVMKADLANTGQEKLPVPKEPTELFEVYIKVEAIDEAGNKGSDHTAESVKVDLKEPTIRVIDVIGGQGGNSGAVSPPPPPVPPGP